MSKNTRTMKLVAKGLANKIPLKGKRLHNLAIGVRAEAWTSSCNNLSEINAH